MASAWPEETFTCSVCLDTLNDPATLPCGHTYCLACIQGHWDRGDTRGQYSCPQCRQAFSPRPSLARSTVLVEAMERLRAQQENQEGPYLTLSSAPPSVPVYLEVFPDAGAGSGARPARHGSVYPQLPAVAPKPCPQHQRPMDLYCHDDKECVCSECCRRGHQGHRVARPNEARMESQRALADMQAETQRRILETEKELQDLPQAARENTALAQALKKDMADVFAELAQDVGQMGAQVGELLGAHAASLGSRVEGHVQRLEQRVAQLRWKGEELGRLADMQDDICFLKNFLTLEPLVRGGGGDWSGLGEEGAAVEGVRTAAAELRHGLQDLCKASLAKIFRAVNDASMGMTSGKPATGSGATVDNGDASAQNNAISNMPEVSPSPRLNTAYEMMTRPAPPFPPRPPGTCTARPASSSTPPPQLPPRCQAPPVTAPGLANAEPKSREDLLKFRFEPTLDPNTAYRHLRLSDGERKATMRAPDLNPPDHPDRFLFWRQVLGREPLAGSPYYWETEWTGQKITVGVAYKEMDRKSSDDGSRLGHNAQSWGLYWSGAGFSLWHAGTETQLGSPKARRLGVYLDQHAGVLAFYSVSNSQAQLIHSLQTQFTGPLYPGFRFWSGVGATVTLCRLD